MHYNGLVQRTRKGKTKMKITYKQFKEIARDLHAFDILETWDEQGFNMYCEEFGLMTREKAINLCSFCESVSREELAAGEYFARI